MICDTCELNYRFMCIHKPPKTNECDYFKQIVSDDIVKTNTIDDTKHFWRNLYERLFK